MSLLGFNFRRLDAVSRLLLMLSISNVAFSDGLGDNVPANVRPIPPVGIDLSQSVRDELARSATQIRDAVDKAVGSSAAERAEVLIFARAIELALEQSTIFKEQETEQARGLVAMALRRAASLLAKELKVGIPQWMRDEIEATSKSNPNSTLIVGGFRSNIDGSIQPYGLVVPKSFKPGESKSMRLDVWLHGRGEQVCEVQFLSQRSTQVGEISPDNTIVLHPFGRYSNAFKFAGEIDVLEAIEHVKTLLPIDDDRISIRGFSMGGAGCWQMAVHYPGMWMAATPGAGFCETRQFLKVFQQEDFVPTDYQAPLLHWYDCPDWGNNLRYLPTIAYSGELDKQKQAADLMEQTLRERGIEIPHIIGPKTAHKLDPDAKLEIERRLSELSQSGRKQVPREIDFTTYTLRYHESSWVHVDGLETHWVEARVQAQIEPNDSIILTTQNVAGLTLGPITDSAIHKIKSLVIDGQVLAIAPSSDIELAKTILRKIENHWSLVNAEPKSQSLHKRPGLQGPIDDAFLSPFIFVEPMQVVEPTTVDQWVVAEFNHAKSEWRRHFRGDVNAKLAQDVSDEDKRTKNLVLFGTPSSNPLIAEVMKALPLKSLPRTWTSKNAVIAIYPSPFAADRYVVINSGFTFREYAYLNNARQISMLPDWAIVDVSAGATTQLPGKIVEAGFFDESWLLK